MPKKSAPKKSAPEKSAKKSDEENKRSIKYYFKKYVQSSQEDFKGKVAIDIPAGKGYTSALLAQAGAKVIPYDLFPENFIALPGVKCLKADLSQKLPLKDNSADYIFCQEGIEHIADQMFIMQEFNRVLKPGGALFITTPNYSSLRSKLSYFINESERFRTMMPPNEQDSIWGVSADKKRIYFGHVFLIGIQKIRILGALAGFNITKVIPNRIKTSSLCLFLAFYPFIWLFNYKAYFSGLHRRGDSPDRKAVYKQILQLNLNPRVLLDGFLFLKLEKVKTVKQVIKDMEIKKHTLSSK